ncbi:MAG: chloride channel protein [Phycisphaerae bacterium]
MKPASTLAARGQRLRLILINAFAKAGFKEEYFLVLVAMLIGTATGVFAKFFYQLIEFARYAAFGETGAGGLFEGRPWMLVLLPTSGGLAVGLITYYFASETKGHGVPEVMDAIYRKGGDIRGRVAGAKAVASALTIGSGGSAGTEGPIIQIGAALGSTLGRYLGIQRGQMGVVVACGISAGIAAIFNAPIAGVLFALEIFLKDFSFRTFSPVVFSSVISCSIMHALSDQDVAIFEVGALRGVQYVFSGAELPLFLVLGILCALASVVFIKALYGLEDLTDAIQIPEAAKPAAGGLLLGLLGVAFLMIGGSQRMPAFFGNGYPAIQMLLSKEILATTAGSLLLLGVLKTLATCLTLGSGGSGGVFAPSLLMGAALGASFGLVMRNIGLIPDANVTAYALVGMGATVAGATHAPLTAIVMLYEITREPKVILPVMFASIVATFGAQALLRDSIYTLKLRRRGVRIGSITDLTLMRKIAVDDIDESPVQFVHADEPLQNLIEKAGETGAVDFVVLDHKGAYQGLVTGKDVRVALLEPEAVLLLLVGELVRSDVPTVTYRETLDTVLDKFARSDVESLPVVNESDGTRVEGVITRQAVMRRYQEELEKQSE